MDKRSDASSMRLASTVYSPTPAHSEQVSCLEDGKTVSAMKQRDPPRNINDNSNHCSGDADQIQNDEFELTLLKEKVSNLEQELLKKEEAIKSAKESLNKITSASAVVIEEMINEVDEEEELLNSALSRLYDIKIMLGDRRAALEKLDLETETSNGEVEELVHRFVTVELDMTSDAYRNDHHYKPPSV